MNAMAGTSFDPAQILFSSSFRITDYISVRHSTLGDVINSGEKRYYHTLQLLTAIPSDEKYLLHKNGIDWMEISDLEFFSMMVKSIPKEDVAIFLPGIDFSRFEMYKTPDGDCRFSDKDAGITFDFYSHKRMLDCLCAIHRIKKKVEKAGNAYTKEVLIEDDKERHQLAAAKAELDKGDNSALGSLISALVNRDGFKYDYQTVMDMRYGQFMDAAARLQLIVATDQLVQGIYAGNVDPNKIDKKRLDWTRAL